MIDPKLVNNRIQYELAEAIKNADGKLHIDEALIIAGTPCVLVDYAKEPDSTLRYISRAMRSFFKRNPRYTRFTKAAVSEGLRQDWLPTLEDEEKRMMLCDFKMTKGVDADGYLIYDVEWVNRLNAKPNPDRETYGRDNYTRVNLNGAKTRIRKSEKAQIFYHQNIEEEYCLAPLDITTDEWYSIIQDASPLAKEMLACYIQIPDGRASCLDIQNMFGIDAASINSRNTALGRRAQAMLDIEVYEWEDMSRPDNRRFWSTAMTMGRWERDGNEKSFRWTMRPELMEAAKRLAGEENWDLPKRIN